MIDQYAATLAQAGTIMMELHPHLHPHSAGVLDRIRHSICVHQFQRPS